MRNKYFWAALCWTAGIAVSCLISIKHFETEPYSLEHKDKYVHCTFYFVFTVLWYLALKQQHLLRGARGRLTVFLGAVTYGVLMELGQEFLTTDRSADIQDALANTLGSVLAVIALWLFDRKKK